DPAIRAVVDPHADAAIGVLRELDADRALVRRVGEDLELAVAAEAAEADAVAGRDVVADARPLLRAAGRRDELVEDLRRRRLLRIAGDEVVDLVVWRFVQPRELNRRRRCDAAVMAGPAGDALRAAEEFLVQIGDHLDHPSRGLLTRR